MTPKRRYVGPRLPLPESLPKAVNTAPKMRKIKSFGTVYELEVSYSGYDQSVDAQIAKIAGLRNYDSGYAFEPQVRDLQFPCGAGAEGKALAHAAAQRLKVVDYFNSLDVRVRYPDITRGRDTFSQYYCPKGHLIKEVKHRKCAELPFVVKRVKVKGRRRLRRYTVKRKKSA